MVFCKFRSCFLPKIMAIASATPSILQFSQSIPDLYNVSIDYLVGIIDNLAPYKRKHTEKAYHKVLLGRHSQNMHKTLYRFSYVSCSHTHGQNLFGKSSKSKATAWICAVLRRFFSTFLTKIRIMPLQSPTQHRQR